MTRRRRRLTKRNELDYVAIYGDRRCVVTDSSDDSTTAWAHLDDDPSNTRALNLVRLNHALNWALESSRRGRLDLPFELRAGSLIERSHYHAQLGRFGKAYGCARLATYVACPWLKHQARSRKSPGDLPRAVVGAVRALANSRVLGRVDLATDVMRRDVWKLLARNEKTPDIAPVDAASLVTQIGGFFRDQGDRDLDEELERLALCIAGGSTHRPLMHSSVALRNAAIRDVECFPRSASEKLGLALEVSQDQVGTESRAQRVWLARVKVQQGELARSTELIKGVYQGAGAPISPDFHSRGYQRGSSLGSFTWQTLIEGLLTQAAALRRMGGRHSSACDAYYETAHRAILESGVLPTDALGDEILIPFRRWLERANRTVSVRMKIDRWYRYWAKKITGAIDRQFPSK